MKRSSLLQSDLDSRDAQRADHLCCTARIRQARGNIEAGSERWWIPKDADRRRRAQGYRNTERG